MSVVQGSDLGGHRGESHRLHFTPHMVLIPRGPAVELLVKEFPLSFLQSLWPIPIQVQFVLYVREFVMLSYIISALKQRYLVTWSQNQSLPHNSELLATNEATNNLT